MGLDRSKSITPNKLVSNDSNVTPSEIPHKMSKPKKTIEGLKPFSVSSPLFNYLLAIFSYLCNAVKHLVTNYCHKGGVDNSTKCELTTGP